MKITKRSGSSAVFVLCGMVAAALSGCTTYVEHRPTRTVYVPPPVVPPPPVVATPVESPVVVIQTESDFYEPLGAHGEWVVVGTYGRCWRPTHVELGWRPYGDGYWRRTDAGWYWASEEPWGWATYHYGRWDWSVEFGWIWMPHTQWAPAWVFWRQGAGYVGWAPLPPSARIGARGIVEVQETAIAPRAFVFVNEQRLLERVRPTTVVVNNTTVINQTVNLTQIQVVNKTVINEGPRPESIERNSGRKIETVPVRELRRRDETEVADRRRNIPSTIQKSAQRVSTEAAPAKTIPVRDRRPVVTLAEANTEPQQLPTRIEARKPAEIRPAPSSTQPDLERPVGTERRPRPESEKARPQTAPANAAIKRESSVVHPHETRPASEPIQPRQPPTKRNEVHSAVQLKPAVTPARPESSKAVGYPRQRELDREQIKPVSPPSAVGKPTRPASSKHVEKPATPASEKTDVQKRGEAKKQVEDKKKSDASPSSKSPVPQQS
jgi:hypothetical protein